MANVYVTVVFETGHGLQAEFGDGDEQAADALARKHQRLGQRARYVLLEGDGHGQTEK